MEKSYEVLRNALQKSGIKKAALVLKVSPALIYPQRRRPRACPGMNAHRGYSKWCQESRVEEESTGSGANNPLDRIRKIYELTGDETVIQWFCQLAGGYFVRNPDEDVSLDTRVMNNVHRMIREFSETLEAISCSYCDDKQISPEEACKIRKEWDDLKRIGESFVKGCESGRFSGKKPREGRVKSDLPARKPGRARIPGESL